MSEKQLSWQLGFSLSRKPAKRTAPRRNAQRGFEFVIEEPQISHRYRRARRSPTQTARVYHAGPPRRLSTSFSSESRHPIVPDAGVHTTNSANNEVIEETDDEPSLDTYPSSLELGPSHTTALTTLATVPYFDYQPGPNTIEYDSLADRFRPILARCITSVHHGPNPPPTQTKIDS